MKAVWRLRVTIAAAGLWLGQTPALAQSAPAATTNTPAPATVGPRELQNFNLQGTVTRPAEAPPLARPRETTEPAPTVRPRASAEAAGAPSAHATGQPMTRPARTARTRVEAAAPPATEAAQSSETLPFTATATPASATPVSLPTMTPTDLAPQPDLAIWPWFLAALALGAGGAFLFWRRRSREAYAGGPQVDEFLAPQPEPTPQPRSPVPPPISPPVPPQPVGFVSSRMRPWIEIGFQPARCIVEEQRVTFEFELELFNSGNAPARDVLIEANFFNASPNQDEEITAFFGSTGQGERIAAIPPLQRISLRPQLAVSLEQIRVLEAGGRRVFVPLVAFNALYGWGGGAGQTAAAYLLGRDTKGEKLAPFRLDLGPRVFRGLGARALPLALRS